MVRKFLLLSLRVLTFLGMGICLVPSAQAADDEFAQSVRDLLASGNHPLLRMGNFMRDRTILEQLYADRGYAPVWFRQQQQWSLTPQATVLLQTLRTADDYGLRAADYDGTALTYAAIEHIEARTAQSQAQLDAGLSVAVARFLRHLHFGRVDPRLAGFNLNTPRAPFDLSAAIAQAAVTDDLAATLASIEPQFLHYRLLKSAMKHYRLLALQPELTDLPSFKARSIKIGDEYEGLPALRHLLATLGDLPADAVSTDDTRLSDTDAAALELFQQRHGLPADGALGRKTFAALTTPLAARAEQLALTLERWRWLPELKAPPIIVNIPEFKLFAFRTTEDRAASIEQMDVIVGKTFPTTQTPIFAADMKYVVFRPYWDVPDSILRKEMLPEIRRDPNYLAKNNLEIVSSSDGNAPPIEFSEAALAQLEAGSVRLRQRPGSDNALGLVKLMFPNPYNVYLHSTPAKRLFNESRRAFSHGCIRVSDPVGLVEYVLRDEPGDWTREKIEAAMNDDTAAGQNRHVFLSTNKQLPVLIVYGTAMALESGDVQFFEDIYGHDAKLAALLRQTR